MKDDNLYLIHIRECIEKVERYAAIGREAFLSSELHQDAIVRTLQVLAESAKRMSAQFRAKHPDVDWKGIAGFRNVAVHDYLGIDLERVWEIVQTDIPALKDKLAESWTSLPQRPEG